MPLCPKEAEANPGNSFMLLKGLALNILCALAMLYLLQMTSCTLGYLFHTGTSAHNLRQGRELIVLNTAALYPPFYGICS